MPSTPWLTPGYVGLDEASEYGGHAGAIHTGADVNSSLNLINADGINISSYCAFNDPSREDNHVTVTGFNLIRIGEEGEQLIPAYSQITGIEVRVLASSHVLDPDYNGPLDADAFRVGIMPYANPNATPTDGTNPAGNIDVYKWKYAQGPYNTLHYDWGAISGPGAAYHTDTGEQFTPATEHYNPRYKDLETGIIGGSLITIQQNAKTSGEKSEDRKMVGPGYTHHQGEPFPYYFGGPDSKWGLTFPVIPSSADAQNRYMYGNDNTFAIRVEHVGSDDRINNCLRFAFRIHQIAVKVHYIPNGTGQERTTFSLDSANLDNLGGNLKVGEAKIMAPWTDSDSSDIYSQHSKMGATTSFGSEVAQGYNWWWSRWPNHGYWIMQTGYGSVWDYDFPTYPSYYANQQGNIARIGRKFMHPSNIPMNGNFYQGSSCLYHSDLNNEIDCPQYSVTPDWISQSLFAVELRVQDLMPRFDPDDTEVPSELVSLSFNLDVGVDYRKSNSWYPRDVNMGFYVHLGGWSAGSFETGSGTASDSVSFSAGYVNVQDAEGEDDIYSNPFFYPSFMDIAPDWMTGDVGEGYGAMSGPYYLSGMGIPDQDPIQEIGTGGPDNITPPNLNWWPTDDITDEFSAGGIAENNVFHTLKVDINGGLLDAIKYRAANNPGGTIRLVFRDVRSLQDNDASGSGLYPSPMRDIDIHDFQANMDGYLPYLSSAERIQIRTNTSSVTIRHTKADISKQTKKVMGFFDRNLSSQETPSFNEVMDVDVDQMEVLDCKTHGAGWSLLSQYDFFRFIGPGGDTGGFTMRPEAFSGNEYYIGFSNPYAMHPWDTNNLGNYTNTDFAGILAVNEGPQLSTEEHTCLPMPSGGTSAKNTTEGLYWRGCGSCGSSSDWGGCFTRGVSQRYRATNWGAANFDAGGLWTSGMGSQWHPLAWNLANSTLQNEVESDTGITDCHSNPVSYLDMHRHSNILIAQESSGGFNFHPNYQNMVQEHDGGIMAHPGGASPTPLLWQQMRSAPTWSRFECPPGDVDYSNVPPRRWHAPTGWQLQGLRSGSNYDDKIGLNWSQGTQASDCENGGNSFTTTPSGSTGPGAGVPAPAPFIYLEMSGGSTSYVKNEDDVDYAAHPGNNRHSIIQSPNIDVSHVDPSSLFFEMFVYQYSREENDQNTAATHQRYFSVANDGSRIPVNDAGIGRTFVDVIRMDPALSPVGMDYGVQHPDPYGNGTEAFWQSAPLDLYWDPGTCHHADGTSTSIAENPAMTEAYCCTLSGGVYAPPLRSFVGGGCTQPINYTGGPIDPSGTPVEMPGRSLGFNTYDACQGPGEDEVLYPGFTPMGNIQYVEDIPEYNVYGLRHPQSCIRQATIPVNYGRIQNGYYYGGGCSSYDPLCGWARVRARLSDFVNPDINDDDNIIKIQIRHLSVPLKSNTSRDAELWLGGPASNDNYHNYRTDILATKFRLIGDKWDVPDVEPLNFSGDWGLPGGGDKPTEDSDDGENAT